MLRKGDNLRDLHMHARDGDMGYIDDLLFHDDRWNVRYVVINTRRWLPGRKVLLVPDVLGAVEIGTKRLTVDLTKDQVKKSPRIDADKPVSRQKEIDLFEYYGWSPYWGAGHGGFTQPVVADVTPEQVELSGVNAPGDPHLRSMRAVRGYAIDAFNGLMGEVEDFIVDDDAWVVRYLVVDTHKWLSGRKVILAPSWVARINWQERTLVTELSKEQIKESPPYDSAQAIDRDYEARIHDYYGRPYYWQTPVSSHAGG